MWIQKEAFIWDNKCGRSDYLFDSDTTRESRVGCLRVTHRDAPGQSRLPNFLNRAAAFDSLFFYYH